MIFVAVLWFSPVIIILPAIISDIPSVCYWSIMILVTDSVVK